MVQELQGLVDALAERLGRAILVEDSDQRVITYSAHADEGDEVRKEAILRRRSPAHAVSWAQRFGISAARGPVRVPGNESLRLASRVCVPIRHGETLLGHMWFVDEDETMTDGEIELATDSAPQFALALYAYRMASERAARREAETVRYLLLGEEGARSHAADVLRQEGRFEPGRHVAALVVRPRVAGDEPPPDGVRLGLETALGTVSRRLAPRSALALVRFDHGVVLVATEARPARAAVAEHAGVLEECLVEIFGPAPGDVPLVGVGDPRRTLAEAHDSYAEALRAARIAAQGEAAGIGRIAYWSELGVYRLLAQLPADEAAGAVLHPGLERLLAQPRSRTLVETLETYLDAAGSVQETAARLRLHRQSLYYRLERIERLASTNLRDGNERLALHLALKLARVNGRLAG